MTWKIEWDKRALKEFRKISKPDQVLIKKYLTNRIAKIDNPRLFGKSLANSLSGLWRYRVSNYRIICNFEEHKMIVFVVAVGHRKQIYDA